jgi:hypothetical protein
LKFFDTLPLIVVLALLAVLGFFGYKIYDDYQQNKDSNAPGTTPGSASAGSFGSYVDDSLFSIGQSSQDLATAQITFGTHPIDTLKSIFGIGDDGN